MKNRPLVSRKSGTELELLSLEKTSPKREFSYLPSVSIVVVNVCPPIFNSTTVAFAGDNSSTADIASGLISLDDISAISKNEPNTSKKCTF